MIPTTNRTCVKCAKPIHYCGRGKPPKHCIEHRPQKARDQVNAQRRARGETVKLSAKEVELRAAAKLRADEFTENRGTSPTPSSWYSRMLAVGLGLDADPLRAGALMGIQMPARDIEKLAEEARKHKDLIDRRPGAIGALLLTAIATGSVRLAAGMDGVPLSQLPGALRACAQSLELVQGSTMPSYSEIRLVVKQPGDDPDKKKVA